MKNRNRISILCLLLALATLLCACGSAPAQTGDEPAPAESTDAPAPAASTEEPEAPAVEVPDQYKSTADVWSGITLSESPYGYNYDLNYNGRTDITGEYLHGAGSWPICDWGEIELSIWFPMNDQISRTVTDWGDGTNYLFAIMQEKTGIKLDFDTCSSAANATQFPLMIASGNVCDIIQNATIYSGGLSKALQDDVIRDLSDIIEECAPNYLHWLNKREADVREGKLDGGEIVMIYSMGREMQAPIFGPVIRRDWLEDAGLEIPKTIDDWHTMLCTFRDNYSTGEPLDFYTSCYDYGQTFNGAYDVYLNNTNFFIQRGDYQLVPSITTDGMRDYLTTMAQWYAEGLLDKDFASTSFIDNERVNNNECGATGGLLFTMAGDFYTKLGADESFFFEIIAPPVRSEGAERHVYYKGVNANTLAHSGVSIAADCDHPKEALRMLDWTYTEEGTTVCEYGLEGVTFHFDENNHPLQTELIFDNPDGLSSSNAQDMYMCNNNFGVFTLNREHDVLDEAKVIYDSIWSTLGDWNVDGTFAYTPEESAERTGLVNDLWTYVQEFMAKVVSGQITLDDAAWNEYLKNVDNYQIDRITEITQAAYNRYLAR